MAEFHSIQHGPGFKDLSGQVFSRLTVLGYEFTRDGNAYFRCHCLCGMEIVTSGNSLKRGDAQSCGCMRAEKRSTCKNLSNGLVYGRWEAMVSRCTNPKNSGYKRYGGRGIVVCERWLKSSLAFIEDMGNPPTLKHSIERIDNNGPYSPENCRWATRAEQNRNMRRNRLFTLHGKTMCLTDWARHLGLSPSTIHKRAARNLPVEQILAVN